MARELSVLFSPQSIALIGASRNPEKVGAVVLQNISDSKYTGKIFPVNPNADNINGHQCYPDINSLPETPDLAIIALPAEHVIEALNQVGEKGIKNVVVYSAGFREVGAAGEALEKQLIETANKYSMNLLGPNCMGYVNNILPVNATFGEVVNLPGNIRFVTQSGALASSLFDWCKSTGLGFAEFVTLGNKAVLSENDVLQYFQNTQITLSDQDKEGLSDVNPIGLYLESISNGTEFLNIAEQISRTNPIFVIKPGKSTAAAKAMQSHTGAIAGEDAVMSAAFEQAGIIRCETLEDFFDLARGFAWEKAPVGPNVGIISNAGGPAVISADAVVSEGLQLTEFDNETHEKLLQVLPRYASSMNPVDVLGDALADRYAAAAEIVLNTNQVDALVVILTPQLMTQIEKTAELIGNLSKKYQKPIFCSFMGGMLVAEGERILNKFRIPSYRFPERAIAAIGAMYRWKKKAQEEKPAESPAEVQLDLEKMKGIISNARTNNVKALGTFESNEMLQATGITTPPTKAVLNIDEAKTFAKEVGWPIVLKLTCPDLMHKTELGGVITDILNEQQLIVAWDKMQSIVVHELSAEMCPLARIMMQKQIINGVEVIVGIKRDPTFGPVMLFGAGGTYAELIADRNLHLLPIDKTRAKKLVEKSKIYTILKGYRGKPPFALDKLYDALVRIAKLAEAEPDALEIDVNPIVVTLNDTFAVDAKVVLKPEERRPVAGPAFKVATTLTHEIPASKFHHLVFEAENAFTFQPGQYVSVKVANNRINAYSVMNHPDDKKFELLVDSSPGGPGSKFFENLKVGEKISFIGPFGIFTLKPDDGAKQMLFMGTGSGCVPLRCMIESALIEQKSTIPITLYFGLRYSEDIFWKEHFEQLAKDHPNFNFKLVLSKPDENWQGLSGHITDIAANDHKDASDCSVYLCGNKLMIEEAKQMMTACGCPPERVYSEHFF